MKSILCFFIGMTAMACSSTGSPDKEKPVEQWAVPCVSTAHIRTEPRHGAEMSSQALMGTPLRVTPDGNSGWVRVETPEGYTGYVNGNTLTQMTDSAYGKWLVSPRLIVTAYDEIKVLADTSCFNHIVSDLVPGCIVVGSKQSGATYTAVELPDGRKGYVMSADVTDLNLWASTAPSAEQILEFAKAQMGSPYLWGGVSTKGMDCSGLTKLAYYGSGIILPRDASQQALIGTEVDIDSLHMGDLLFFGNQETGRVNHVGIYDSDGYFVEASGMVRRGLLSENKSFLFARRVLGNDDGHLYANNHSWYFTNN